VSYGTAGLRSGRTARERPGKGEERNATLAVNVSGRRVLSRPIVLPDSGIVSTDLTLSPSQAFYRPFTGSSPTGAWQVLEVRLGGVAGDPEPRDDARRFVPEVEPDSPPRGPRSPGPRRDACTATGTCHRPPRGLRRSRARSPASRGTHCRPLRPWWSSRPTARPRSRWRRASRGAARHARSWRCPSA